MVRTILDGILDFYHMNTNLQKVLILNVTDPLLISTMTHHFLKFVLGFRNTFSVVRIDHENQTLRVLQNNFSDFKTTLITGSWCPGFKHTWQFQSCDHWKIGHLVRNKNGVPKQNHSMIGNLIFYRSFNCLLGLISVKGFSSISYYSPPN